MTARRPTFPPADLADTLDEASPREVTRPGRAQSGNIKPPGVPEHEPYYDSGPGEIAAPENEDFHGRISLLEQLRKDADARIRAAHLLAEQSGTWNRRIFKALVGLTGVAGAALLFALSVARSNGDATGEKRARDIERARYIAIIDKLVSDVSRHEGILGSLIDALRSRYPIGALPLVGPPRQDQVPPP